MTGVDPKVSHRPAPEIVASMIGAVVAVTLLFYCVTILPLDGRPCQERFFLSR